MKNIISVIVLTVFLSNTLFGTWALISLDELVDDTDLIVTGTLHSTTENSEGLGRGYIIVDQVFTIGVNTFDGVALKQGDNLKITWADNWACAAGMHRARENEHGIWLLEVQKDGTVTAAYPGRFRTLDDLHEIEMLQRRKQARGSERVDVLPEVTDATSVDSLASPNPKSVDVLPFNDHSPLNALIIAVLSLGLYVILYRSRFRIR